jgi:hypothetical protein
VLLGAAGGLILARVLAWPATAGPVPADPQAGLRVQATLAQLLLREAGLSSRQEPLALTDAEVNAFLAQNVHVRDAPVWPVHVRIEAGGVELGGPTTVERLVRELVGSGPAGLLPRSVGGRSVWVAARGRIDVAPGGRTEFQADSGTMGLQTVPVALLWRAVGGRPLALVWRMPRVVDRVELEPGRLVIHTRRARPGSPTG